MNVERKQHDAQLKSPPGSPPSADLTLSIVRLMNTYLQSAIFLGGPLPQPDKNAFGERRDANINADTHFPNVRNKAQAKRVLQQIKASAATLRAKGLHLTLAEREFLDAYDSVFEAETLDPGAKASSHRSLSTDQRIREFLANEQAIEQMRQDIAGEYSAIEHMLTPEDRKDTLARVLSAAARRKPQPN
jgi:hypothetical protein